MDLQPWPRCTRGQMRTSRTEAISVLAWLQPFLFTALGLSGAPGPHKASDRTWLFRCEEPK